MCGILCIFGDYHDIDVDHESIKHRGPDDFNVITRDGVKMFFYRLAIRGGGDMQPFITDNELFMCNGEIYNHLALGGSPNESDCKTLLREIQRDGVMTACKNVNTSEFAFVYHINGTLFAARDNVGVRPLFFTVPKPGTIIFSSELKPIKHFKCGVFPPGHFYNSITGTFARWMKLASPEPVFYEDYQTRIKNGLIKAVLDRADNSEREVCFLLSGGLDSSLVCAIAFFHSNLKAINMFTVGEENSPDVVAAKKVVKFFEKCRDKKITHTVIPFDFEEGKRLVPDVIKSLESYDTTTIRASVPMWIMSRYISKNTNYRVLLSGEGSDELLAGYKYFKNAPSQSDLHLEVVRRVHKLHEFDVLRADRCTAAHGLELRVPFLDVRVVDACLGTHPKNKMSNIEKGCLRCLFEGYLPGDILWRTKEAFSDAVGYDWVTFIKTQYKDYPMVKDKHNSPTTGEESFYRQTYWDIFGHLNDDLISEIWRPKWTDVQDPSARFI